jgi:ubiquinone/menaquinone biosynthesis C-methylase UbiE
MRRQSEKIIKTYDATADNYAAERIDELSNKHIDRLLLEEFASVNKDKGRCADFGCGPGQTTRFLYDHGLRDIIGLDISRGMIDAARRYSPEIEFETGDLLAVSYPANYFGSAIAFYSIVHFSYDQIEIAFSEVNRVLKKGGQFLFSFHVGNETVHYDVAGGVAVDIDLYLFETGKILKLLTDGGFRIIDAIERQPYDAEYPTRRAYILAERI